MTKRKTKTKTAETVLPPPAPTFQPTNDRVLFVREMKSEQPNEVIVNTKAYNEPTMICVIKAVGPKCELLKVGDRVIVPFNYGQPVGDLGFICREQDVHAVLS